MSDGIYLKRGNRPQSKKAVKEAIAADPSKVWVECTSLHGGYDGPVSEIPEGKSIHFVGPDPYISRKFYGTIKMKNGRPVVT
jgi:hypothetical protein